jgi:hypothetical protein
VFELGKGGTLPLELHPSSLCSGYCGDGSLMNYLPGLALNLDPPGLHILIT